MEVQRARGRLRAARQPAAGARKRGTRNTGRGVTSPPTACCRWNPRPTTRRAATARPRRGNAATEALSPERERRRGHAGGRRGEARWDTVGTDAGARGHTQGWPAHRARAASERRCSAAARRERTQEEGHGSERAHARVAFVARGAGVTGADATARGRTQGRHSERRAVATRTAAGTSRHARGRARAACSPQTAKVDGRGAVAPSDGQPLALDEHQTRRDH